MKHTKGPWKVFNNGIIYDAGYGGPFRSVCEMNGNNNEPNATLIAAAPDMLAALEIIFTNSITLDLKKDPHHRAIQDAAFAAITKATGQEPMLTAGHTKNDW